MCNCPDEPDVVETDEALRDSYPNEYFPDIPTKPSFSHEDDFEAKSETITWGE